MKNAQLIEKLLELEGDIEQASADVWALVRADQDAPEDVPLLTEDGSAHLEHLRYHVFTASRYARLVCDHAGADWKASRGPAALLRARFEELAG